MDVSNLDGNGTGAVLYLDPYAFQETNYQTSGGGTAVCAEGRPALQHGHPDGHQSVSRRRDVQRRGIAAWGPRTTRRTCAPSLLAAVPAVALAANPNIVPGADILKIYDVGAWLAGPIVRDKLWFSFSAHDTRLDQYLLGNYNPDGTQVLDDNLMWTTSAKVAWQVTAPPSSRIQQPAIQADRSPEWRGTFAESRARNSTTSTPDVHQVKFTSPFGSRVVVDVSWSRFRADDKFGQEPEVQAGDISRFDALTNTYTVALPTYPGQRDVQGSSPDQRGLLYRTS